MSDTLPALNYTTPEDFINYYYQQLQSDLNVYDLQISKVGFVGFVLNLLGYTHFDLKQYYDSLFIESFPGTAQTEESQYIHASTYGYIPSFATASTATGTVEFDMINWLPRRQSGVVRREVIVGYAISSGTYVALSSTFFTNNVQFSIDAIYKFVEIEENGSYYYYADITTSDGTKTTVPSSSSLISVPLYSTSQYVKKEITTQLKPYNFGTFQTYYFGIDAGYYLSDLKVYVTEVGTTIEVPYTIQYTKYLSKGSDTTVFLRKVTATNYVIEFGSGSRGKWISGATVRLVIKSTNGKAGNLINKSSLKIQMSGTVLAFDYLYGTDGQLTSINQSILQQPLVDFSYSEGGQNPLSGEDLRDAIVNYIQTRDNLMSQLDFYNVASKYFDDFKFLFKKANIYDNIFYLYRSFRDRNQTIFYSTNYANQIMNLKSTGLIAFSVSVVATTGGSLTTDTYGYFVTAIDDWGQSVPSAVKTAYVDTGAGNSAVTITWDAVPYATKYRIYGRYPTYRDQYWEVTDTGAGSYSYTDDATNGTSCTEPVSYALQDINYQPTFTIDGTSFISPFVYEGNTRMNYYDGYLIKDLARIEFAEIVPEISILGTGFDVPMVYLNLSYNKAVPSTSILLKSYQTISNLVFTVSIFGENLSLSNKRMTCFPLANNYFEYDFTNASTFGIFEGEIQVQIKGGTSDSVLTNNHGDFTIGTGTTDKLKIKFNDSSTGYVNLFTTVTLTSGTPSAATLATDINNATSTTAVSVYIDDDGNSRIRITPPTGGTVANVFIGSTGSTCLAALGLTGSDITPAIQNGPLTNIAFTCTTDKFYQLIDVSDQIRLLRYNVGNDSYLVNIPVIDNTVFATDPDYYTDKIKNFITTISFTENRMVTDNIQCRFLNSYLIESPYIESTFLQSAKIFSSSDYNWLDPIAEIRDNPPTLPFDGSRYLVSTTPTGGSAFEGHANEVAIYSSGWSFYSPTANDFVLDTEIIIYYIWSGAAWINIPSILLPLKMRIEIAADKTYVQRNNIDLASEKDKLLLSVAEYLQKGFTGSSIVFYNSMIVEFIHTGRPYIKSVKVYVTDSSVTPNEMNNGIEVDADANIVGNLASKLDIVKYVPSIIYWNVDALDIIISII